MNIDDVFNSEKPGCRLIIDRGLPPWDQVAPRSYAGALAKVSGDRLSGPLFDEWEMVFWKQSVAQVHTWLVNTRQQPVGAGVGAEVGAGQESLDPFDVLEAGAALQEADIGVLQQFRPAPPSRLSITVTHSDNPLFTVRKLDDGATLDFVHDPQQAVQDLGRALVYESGNVGGTFLRPILIDGFSPVWDF